MNYVQNLLCSRMFPDYYQPAPVVDAAVSVLIVEPTSEPMKSCVSFAEILDSVGEFYQRIEGQTSTPSFPRLTASGLMVRGAYWMLNISEYPNEDDGFLLSSLTEILETQSDWMARHPGKNYQDWLNYIQNFYLSTTACAGIIRRAKERGRILPEHLRRVLEEVVAQTKLEAE